MQLIPMQAVPAQLISTVIGAHLYEITLYQKADYLFVDLTMDGQAIVTGRICRHRVPLVNRPYLGVAGDFMIVDTQGTRDPSYTELGSRYQLVHVDANDQF